MSIYIYSRVSEDMPSDAYLGVNSPLTDPPGPPRKLSTNINISDKHARDKIPLSSEDRGRGTVRYAARRIWTDDVVA